MSLPHTNVRVELGSIEVLPGRDGIVIGLVGAGDEALRMELPAHAVHQLMRWLPRVDAALQAGQQPAAAVAAYPVVRWSVRSVAKQRSVALSMMNDMHVASAFVLGPDEARAIHTALGEAISAAGAGRIDTHDRANAGLSAQAAAQAAA